MTVSFLDKGKFWHYNSEEINHLKDLYQSFPSNDICFKINDNCIYNNSISGVTLGNTKKKILYSRIQLPTNDLIISLKDK